ncbi:hypothetical protein Salmuc_01850 [Salipiger mucosus DSM 16094]|uniref:Uncharacterized protein n=1 Tax=Salipiger mucosus DSM 16094 TaxID=1123237 RepID=S9S1K1_9RHOB|nr:hypothetical protein Salmuc_01850 [Salipiger mucosus DSM 16094]
MFYAFLEGEANGEKIDMIAYNATALSTVEVLRDLIGDTIQTPHPGSLRDGSYFKGDVDGADITFDFKDCTRKERDGQVIHSFKDFAPGYANTVGSVKLEHARQQYLEALQAAYQGKTLSQEIDLSGDEHTDTAEVEPDVADMQENSSPDPEVTGETPVADASAPDETEASKPSAETDTDPSADAAESGPEQDTPAETVDDAADVDAPAASESADDPSFGGEEDSKEDYQSRDAEMEASAEADAQDAAEAEQDAPKKGGRLGRRRAARKAPEKAQETTSKPVDEPSENTSEETQETPAEPSEVPATSEPKEDTPAPAASKPAGRPRPKLGRLGARRAASSAPTP